jgi:hypothetical protein
MQLKYKHVSCIFLLILLNLNYFAFLNILNLLMHNIIMFIVYNLLQINNKQICNG